jgi:hypothetical protein
MQRNDRISVVLVGKDPLAGALAEQMGKAGIGEIELTERL